MIWIIDQKFTKLLFILPKERQGRAQRPISLEAGSQAGEDGWYLSNAEGPERSARRRTGGQAEEDVEEDAGTIYRYFVHSRKVVQKKEL